MKKYQLLLIINVIGLLLLAACSSDEPKPEQNDGASKAVAQTVEAQNFISTTVAQTVAAQSADSAQPEAETTPKPEISSEDSAIPDLSGVIEAAESTEGSAASYNVNLIKNPGNEEPMVNGEIPYWEEVSGTNWGQNAEVPVHGGRAYFDAGEAGAYAELRQDIDVSAYAAAIDAGKQDFLFKAYLRSYPIQAFVPVDGAQVGIEFLDKNGESLDLTTSQEYYVTDRWVEINDTITAPEGTRWIRVRLASIKKGGYDSDGYADDLSLVALQPD